MMWIYSAIFDLTRARHRFRSLSFLCPCERLEHPIVFVILTAIFLIWRGDVVGHYAWLHWSLKFVLFRLGLRLLTRVSFVHSLWRSDNLFALVIVRTCCRIAFPRPHQPFINFFIAFKYAFIVRSTIICAQSSFLSNNKIYLCDNRPIPSWVFSSRRRRLGLELRLSIHCYSSSRALSPDPWNHIGTLGSLFKFNLNCSLLFRNRQTAGSSLKRELKHTTTSSLTIGTLVVCLAVSRCILVLVVTWGILLCINVGILFLDVIFFYHLDVCWLWWIENRRRRIVPQVENFLRDWGNLLMMSFLRMLMDIIWTRSSLIHMVMLIHILDIFDQAMFLHVLNKAWLSICDCLRIISYWNCSRRLSNCCVFNFQTCRQPLRCPVSCRRIQHLYSTAKFFLPAQYPGRSVSDDSLPILVYHPLDEIGSKLLWAISICLRYILLRNLNLLLLFHLNLNICDRWRRLTVND